jgi:hypothetical protein
MKRFKKGDLVTWNKAYAASINYDSYFQEFWRGIGVVVSNSQGDGPRVKWSNGYESTWNPDFLVHANGLQRAILKAKEDGDNI